MNSASLGRAAGLVGLCAALLTPATASARDNDERRGTCANGVEWEIKAKPEDGRIEIEVEIDTDRRGQAWAWTLQHNGSFSARGVTRTRGGGSFDIERTTVDVSGPDTFRFRATRKRTVCVATITV